MDHDSSLVKSAFGVRDRLEVLLAIWPIIDRALMNLVPHLSVTLEIHDGTNRTVNRKFLPIDTKPRDLGVKVREVTALQERVVTKANTGYDVGSAKSDLFNLREVFVNSAVENHLADGLQWDEFFWPNLRSIKNIKLEIMLVCLWNNLDGERPFRVRSSFNRLLEVLAMEI